MAYNYDELFSEIDQYILRHPTITLSDLSENLHCDRRTVEKVVVTKTSLPFRAYRKRQLLGKILVLLKTKASVKEIAFEVGFKWPEHLNRSVKSFTGHTLTDLRKYHV